jgi:tripartite-type tricarboxylate transporter receptor subunit TctC
MRLICSICLAFLTWILPASAFAEFPDRSITVIIPFGPGGGADLTTRTLLPFVEKYLPGASFVPVNRTGGGGEVGFTEIALSAPDGYTIGLVPTPTLTMKPHERKTRYSIDSFTFIANVAYDPSAVAVRADSPYKTVADVVDALKSGKRVVAAIAGIGSEDHLLLARFGGLTGTSVTLAPFDSSGAAMLALLGGQVDLAVTNLTPAAVALGEKSIRVLAVAGEERWTQAPDAPTFTEIGIPLIGGSTRGFAGPANLPEEVTAKLDEAFAAAVSDPEFIASAKQQNVPLRYMDSEELTEFVSRQDKELAEQWARAPWLE